MEPQSRTAPTPPAENAKVWRYVDAMKLLSLLKHKALFFCRPDMLGDPHECALGLPNVQRLLESIKGKTSRDEIAKLVEAYNSKRTRRIDSVAVSCWHLPEEESAAMWQLYAPKGLGIAIQTTVARLHYALSFPFSTNIVGNRPIRIGKVRYVDYDTELIDEDDPVLAAFHKRKAFEHEREYRALIELDLQEQAAPLAYLALRKGGRHIAQKDGSWVLGDHRHAVIPTVVGPGILVRVDIGCLVERLFLAPSAPPDHVALVKDLVSKYHLEVPVEQTELDASPYDRLGF